MFEQTKFYNWFLSITLHLNSGLFSSKLYHSVNTWYQDATRKVQTFWETYKIWKNLPRGFDKSADLLSKRQNNEEDFFKLCVLFKKSKLYLKLVQSFQKKFFEEYLITYINEIFWKLWFLKYFIYWIEMCLIFVGSVHNFGKSDNDII